MTGANYGPSFGSESTVDISWPEGHMFHTGTGKWIKSKEDAIGLVEWPDAVFAAKWFRAKEPNIEALRSLITKLPAKHLEEV